MAKGKKRVRMPRWIWRLPRRWLSASEKRFLGYIWWNGNRGCRDSNYQLARRFDVTDRTVRRWLHHLQHGHLIYINYPFGKLRTIYRLPYFKYSVWQQRLKAQKAKEGRT